MQSLDYCYLTLIISTTYIVSLVSKKEYRLLLPSVVSITAWLINAALLIFELEGWFVTNRISDNTIDKTSQFIFWLTISSIIGFTVAHLFTNIKKEQRKTEAIQLDKIEFVLKKFKWVPYLCCIIGIVLFGYIISTIGLFATFGEFRELAISTIWDGPMAIIKQISGHVNIWSSFYLILLAYKHGQTGIKIKEVIVYIFLCSTINIAIGGRLWMITSALPYFVSLSYSLYISKKVKKAIKKDFRKCIFILVIFAATFSILGSARDDRDVKRNFVDRFLYFTDGSKITNLVLTQYPPGTYELEFGKAEFLTQFMSSPMDNKFKESISDNNGLSVTVQSSMPSLYYDFGFWGGIVMWGLFCYLLELFAIKMVSTRKIYGILVFSQISQLLFLAPIFPIFSVFIQHAEWLIIFYLFRKKIFEQTKTIY